MASTRECGRVLGSTGRPGGWVLATLAASLRQLGVPTRNHQLAADAFNRGVALAEAGDRAAAIIAYRGAIEGADPDLAARAAFNIAALQSDDLRAATVAYLAAIRTGHPDVAPKAAFNLGSLLAEAGELDGARAMLECALSFGHEDVSGRASLALDALPRSSRVCGRRLGGRRMSALRGPIGGRVRRRREPTNPGLRHARRLRDAH